MSPNVKKSSRKVEKEEKEGEKRGKEDQEKSRIEFPSCDREKR